MASFLTSHFRSLQRLNTFPRNRKKDRRSMSSESNKSPPVVKLRLRGQALLDSARWNKGSAFTASERQHFGLTGRLPYAVNTLDQQCARASDQLASQDNDIQKNAFLQSLQEQNIVLYYALLTRKLKELMPIIYTPTEVSSVAHTYIFITEEITLNNNRQMLLHNIPISSDVVKACISLFPTKIAWRKTSSNKYEDAASIWSSARMRKLFWELVTKVLV